MDTLHFERYEFKYFVPEDRSDAIRNFIRPYVAPDSFAARSPNGQYTIHNLYLDTPNLDFYNACINGEPDRFKLRIRWYDDAAQGPFFFEVKRKIRQVIVKDRARVSREELLPILRGEPLSIAEGASFDHLTAFRDRMTLQPAGPTLYSRYTREPYESVFGDYARITLDRSMCYQPARGFQLPEDPGAWSYVDDAWTTGRVRCGLVLELKFTRDFPRWMSDLIAEFNLERIGYSKYISAVLNRLDRDFGGVASERISALSGLPKTGSPAPVIRVLIPECG